MTELPIWWAAAFLDGDGERGSGGGWSLLVYAFDALGSLLRGVKPKPPSDVRVAGLALWERGCVEDVARLMAVANDPSLVPGRLLRSLPFLLILEAGLGGGPIGLSAGEKKLDLRLSFGVVGMFWRLSIVRSLSEGLEPLRSFGGTIAGSSGGSVGESSWKPCPDAERKLSSELSWSWFSSSSVVTTGFLGDGGLLCWLPRDDGLGAIRGPVEIFEGCFRPVPAVFVGCPDPLDGAVDCFKPVLADVEREKDAIDDLFCSFGA